MTRLNRILFPTDFSERADAAVEHAAFMARHYGATLFLLHVVEGEVPDADTTEAGSDIERRVATLRQRFGEKLIAEHAVSTGEAAAPAIADFARDRDIDLVVVSTHGRRGVKRMFLGSVAEEIVRTAPCHVYTIRYDDVLPEPRVPRRILVPVDFSDYGIQALRTAQRFAADGAEIHLIHAVEEFVPPGVYGLEYPSYFELSAEIEQHARTELEEMARRVLQPGTRSAIDVRMGYAPSAIVEYAEDEDMDMIVMSTHGRSGVERWLLGSVAEKVVRTAERPVLIVRSHLQDIQVDG